MKLKMILALAVSASLVGAGLSAVVASSAKENPDLFAEGVSHDELLKIVKPSINPETTGAVTRGTPVAENENSRLYKSDVSVVLSPGSFDLAVYFAYRQKNVEDGQEWSEEALISLNRLVGFDPTPATPVDYEGNIIHGGALRDSHDDDDEEDHDHDPYNDFNVPQTFNVSAQLNNLQCDVVYQVKFVASQVLSGISQTVTRPEIGAAGDKDADYDTDKDDTDKDDTDKDKDGIPDEYDADSYTKAEDLLNAYDSSIGWFDPSLNAGWFDISPFSCPPAPETPAPVNRVADEPTSVPPVPVVVPPTAPIEPESAKIQSAVYFGGDSAVLSRDSLNRIASLYAKLPDNAVNVKVIFKGFVSPTVVTSYDKRLAAARVRNVRMQLQRLGMIAEVSIPTLAVDKKSTATKARRVEIIVTYELPK